MPFSGIMDSEVKSGAGWRWKDTLRIILPTLKTMSVEPIVLIIMTSTLMQYLVYQNFEIENICLVSENHSSEICKEIINGNSTFSEERDQIQKTASKIRSYRSLVDNSFPVLVVIIMGPWSDHYGRKFPLLLSLTGSTLRSISHIIASLYIDTVDPLLITMLTGIPMALAGGDTVMRMACFSYISDITTHKPRTIRTGILSAAVNLGVPLGFTIGGRLISSQMGYTNAFYIGTAMSATALLLAIFIVKNTTAKDRLALELEEGDEKPDEGDKKPGDEKRPGFWDIINPKNNVYLLILLIFRRRKNYGRLKMIILLIAFICIAAPIHGEFNVMYLFLSKRLNWRAEEFGDFSSYNWFIGVLGVIVSMGIFSKWMGLKDQTVGFITGISQMSGCFVYAFAYSKLAIYGASTVDMLNGTMAVVAKSMMSKIVHAEEIGKLFSLMALIETLIPLAVNPLYNYVYRLGLLDEGEHGIKDEPFDGWIFVTSAAFTIPPQLIFLWLICRRDKGSDTSKDLKLEESSDGHSNLGYVDE